MFMLSPDDSFSVIGSEKRSLHHSKNVQPIFFPHGSQRFVVYYVPLFMKYLVMAYSFYFYILF